jgi:DNA-binding CsgD family transcriptional regulator
MVHLSSAVLLRAHRFLLEIHAAPDVETQRRLIPQGLSRLIACDRAALNEFDMSHKQAIVPSPIPAYWARLGPIMTKHHHEHCLGNPAVLPPQHTAMTFGDRRHDPAWKNSTLYQEYYLPAGASQQMGIHVFQHGAVRFQINCNRSGRDFSARDRALLELISPHVESAWRNASELSAFRRQQATLGDSVDQHTVVVDCGSGVIAAVSSGARAMLHKYFDEDAGESSVVPEELRRWLTVQRNLIGCVDAQYFSRQSLQIQKGSSALLARLVQTTMNVAVILLEESHSTVARTALVIDGFTPRENEILHWLGEGKRNSEIGIILSMSTRTVGKHLEHIFEKLGVETRTAAVRAAFEFRKRRDA